MAFPESSRAVTDAQDVKDLRSEHAQAAYFVLDNITASFLQGRRYAWP